MVAPLADGIIMRIYPISIPSVLGLFYRTNIFLFFLGFLLCLLYINILSLYVISMGD